MRSFAQILGVIAIVVGFALCFFAYNATTILRAPGISPSAVQVTQVYSEASFYGIMAIAAFAFAAVVSLGALLVQIEELTGTIEASAESAEKYYIQMRKTNEK